MDKKSSSSCRKIQPVVKILSIAEKKSDFNFWQSLTVQERISALEEIRAEYHRWRGDAQSRLQRVYSITKR